METKIFDIPEDDIRRNLPEWDESRTDRREILFGHSARYISREGLEGPFFSDSDEAALMKWLNLTDNKYAQLKDRFLKKLRTEEKQVIFDGLEERAAEFFVHRSYFGGCPGWGSNLKYYYLPWFFPLSMSEQDVINAVREAYEKARRRSRRILPDQYDYTNICGWSRWVNYGIGSCQSIYQGRADDMVIHFLFDFEKMGIVTAYPVYREAQKNPYYHSPDSRDDPFYTEEEWRQ